MAEVRNADGVIIQGGVFDTLDYEAVDKWDYRTNPHPDRIFFTCPNPDCRLEVEQSPDNYHFWCPHCGMNATDLLTPPQ